MHRTTINLIKKNYEEINIEFCWMRRRTILINKVSRFTLNPNNPKNPIKENPLQKQGEQLKTKHDQVHACMINRAFLRLKKYL